MRRESFGKRAVLLLCLLGCNSSSGVASRDVVTDVQQLVCNPLIGLEPEADLTIYFDGVALPTVDNQASALQEVPQIDASGREVYFSKLGLWFRGSDPITIAIAEPDGTAELAWEGRSQAVVTPIGCGTDPNQWNGIVGGYLVDKPLCLDLRISSGERSETVQAGIGAACPGQGPPEELSG